MAKKILISVFYFITLFKVNDVYCQNMDLYQKEFITINDGLPTNEIYHLIEDRNKYLWMATNNGVVRFDGKNFKIFNTEQGLPHSEVYHLTEQHNGRIYGESRFAQLFYIQNDSVHVFRQNKLLYDYSKGGLQRIYSVLLDKSNNLHLGTPNGYFVFNADEKMIYTNYKEYTSFSHTNFALINNKILTFRNSTDSKGEYTMNRESINKIEKIYNFKKISRTSEAPYATAFNSSTFAIIDGYFVRIVNKDKIICNIQLNNKPVSVKVIDSILWIGMVENGVAAYRINGDTARIVDQLLSGSTVTSILRDHEKGYWFSTREIGLVHICNFNLKRVYQNTNNQNVSYFYKDKNNTFIGLESGQILKGGKEELIFKAPNSISQISGYNNYYSFYSAGSIYRQLMGSGSKLIMDNNFGLAFGALRINDTMEVYYNLNSFYLFNSRRHLISHPSNKDPNKPKPRLNCISIITDDKIAVGTNKDISIYSLHTLDLIKNYTIPSSVVSIFTHKNSVYAACNNGAIYLLKEKAILIKLNPNSNINVIFDAKVNNNTLYVVSNLGIHKFGFSPNEKLNYKSTVNIIGSRKIYVYDDEVFYQTQNAVYKDLEQKHTKNVPILFLDKVFLNGVVTHSKTTFNHNQKNISFSVEGISYAHKSLKYKYKMIGLNNEYQYTLDNFITFSGLNPGDYIFIIAATNNGIDYSDEIAYSFSISKPFWQRAWFVLIVALTISVIAFLIGRSIIRNAKRKSELNENMAKLKSQALTSQLNPHLVFNILNSIQGIISEGEIESANIFISRFSKFMRQSLWASQNAYITIEKELEIEENYISLERMRFPDDLSIEIIRSNRNNEFLVPSLVLQPFIENAIKHGVMPSLRKEGQIIILVSEMINGLEIQIKDNGKGVEGEIMFGDGMRISKERLQLLNKKNSVQIERLNDWTVVTIKLYK